MNTPETIDTLLERLRTLVQAETVVGKAIVCPDGSTVIPVCKVSFGFGAGTGARDPGRQGLGTGGAASIVPVAFLILRSDRTELVPLDKGAFQFSKVLELVPDLVERFTNRPASSEPAD